MNERAELGTDQTAEDQAWLDKVERAMTMLIEDRAAELDGQLGTVIEMRDEVRARRAAFLARVDDQ